MRGAPEIQRVWHVDLIVREANQRPVQRGANIEVNVAVIVEERKPFQVHGTCNLVIVRGGAMSFEIVVGDVPKVLPLLRPQAHSILGKRMIHLIPQEIVRRRRNEQE